jgi:hypothetical protein
VPLRSREQGQYCREKQSEHQQDADTRCCPVLVEELRVRLAASFHASVKQVDRDDEECNDHQHNYDTGANIDAPASIVDLVLIAGLFSGGLYKSQPCVFGGGVVAADFGCEDFLFIISKLISQF